MKRLLKESVMCKKNDKYDVKLKRKKRVHVDQVENDAAGESHARVHLRISSSIGCKLTLTSSL